MEFLKKFFKRNNEIVPGWDKKLRKGGGEEETVGRWEKTTIEEDKWGGLHVSLLITGQATCPYCGFAKKRWGKKCPHFKRKEGKKIIFFDGMY